MKLKNVDAEFDIRAIEFDVVGVELAAGKVKISMGLNAADALRIGGALVRAGRAAKNQPASVSAARISTRLLKKAAR